MRSVTDLPALREHDFVVVLHRIENVGPVCVADRNRPDHAEMLPLRALASLVEHVMRGRSRDVRPPNELEMRATTVLALPLDEASAKIRTGPPVDDDEDYALPVWAGVVPMKLTRGEPIADAGVTLELPAYLR